MPRTITAVLLLLVAAWGFSCAAITHAENEEELWYVGPVCLGSFCFDIPFAELITEVDFVSMYGPGYDAGIGKFAVHCYRVSEQDLYAYFSPYHGEQREILEVFVSRAPNCPDAEPPLIPFQPFVTPEGIQLGDTYQKVIAVYGEPLVTAKGDGMDKVGLDYEEKKRSQPFGDTVLKYGSVDVERILTSKFYIRDNTVTAILVSMYP